jgi:glycosyltransferase involved in cell wall biosynthesis
LDGVVCVSRHVKKVLQDSGVAVPLVVGGNGIDHWLATKVEKGRWWPGKTFRFLHVSSCFPRKGADALLKAFGQAFRAGDDVSLIIKTFVNPHNNVVEHLRTLRATDPNYPDVHVLFDDLPLAQLKSLYDHCHVLVAPSRAEGYGLPIAEALISGLPVIATDWSGQRDFCQPEWSWLVDYSFMPADTHFDLPGSVWADPDLYDLAEKMRQAAGTTSEQRADMARRGSAYLKREHTWDAVARRMHMATEAFIRLERPTLAKIGWVTTWNCACGIATYSDHLIDRIANDIVIFGAQDDECVIPDEANVIRAWRKHAPDDDLSELELAVQKSKVDALVVQFNYDFYNIERLSTFLERMDKSGVPVFIVLHATRDPENRDDRRIVLLSVGLQRCARVIVHSWHDLNRLKTIGIVENSCLIPHGVVAGPNTSFRPAAADRFVLGSYGFCLPHKGLIHLVEAFAHLAGNDPTLRLELVNAEYQVDASHQTAKAIEERIKALGLEQRARFTADFLPDSKSMEKIRACDLLVFAYEATDESASGAVRFGIASGRPVATTRLPIFDDVKPAVFQVNGDTSSSLAVELGQLIAQLRQGGESIDSKAAAADRWRADHSYDSVAAQLMGVIQAFVVESRVNAMISSSRAFRMPVSSSGSKRTFTNVASKASMTANRGLEP